MHCDGSSQGELRCNVASGASDVGGAGGRGEQLTVPTFAAAESGDSNMAAL